MLQQQGCRQTHSKHKRTQTEGKSFLNFTCSFKLFLASQFTVKIRSFPSGHMQIIIKKFQESEKDDLTFLLIPFPSLMIHFFTTNPSFHLTFCDFFHRKHHLTLLLCYSLNERVTLIYFHDFDDHL